MRKCWPSLVLHYIVTVSTHAIWTRHPKTTTYVGSAQKTGDGKTITHRPGIIDFVKDQGEYILETTQHPEGFDTDGDGMPNAWETANAESQ